MEDLRNTLRVQKQADVAAVCYVDFCKASTYIARSEQSALRHIVTEIENELREKLFDPNRPFFDHEGVLDYNLMTECLTALFRLNPRNAIRSIIPDCLDERAPMAFKLVLVKSCLAIASEDKRLPWNPSIASMYASLASPLRRLFQDNLQREKGDAASFMPTTIANTTSRRAIGVKVVDRRRPQEDVADRLEIVLCILRLYKTDPLLAVYVRLRSSLA